MPILGLLFGIRMSLHSGQRQTVQHLAHVSKPDCLAMAFILQAPAVIGRCVLMLATISVLTAPLTQDIWTWDHFLRGGQDFETGMLSILIVLCLAVLLTQTCKRQLDSLLTRYRALAYAFRHGELPGVSIVKAFSVFRVERVRGAAIDSYTLPLKI